MQVARLFRSVFVDRTLEFVAKFACSFLEKEKKEGENGEADAGDQVEETEEALPLFLFKNMMFSLLYSSFLVSVHSIFVAGKGEMEI